MRTLIWLYNTTLCIWMTELEIFFFVYFFTPPQSGKPEVLLQIAVRLTVEIEIENDVMVFVPNETRKRLVGLPSGNLNPDSTTNGIIEG
jgi:hypothetical protein